MWRKENRPAEEADIRTTEMHNTPEVPPGQRVARLPPSS